ncbi:MAG: potassium channel family protein [Malacoplasma sp.]
MLFKEKNNLDQKELQKKIIDERIQSRDARNHSLFPHKKHTLLDKIVKWRRIIFNVLISHTFSHSKKETVISFIYITLLAIFSLVCIVPLISHRKDSLRDDFRIYYYFLISLFAIDWFFRLSFVDIVIKRSEKKFKKFMSYEFSFLALIDLLTWIIPLIFFAIPTSKANNEIYNYVIPMILIMKALTAFRLLYLFNKVASIQTLFSVVKKSIKQLLIVIFIMLMFVFLFSLILYNVEIEVANSKIQYWFDSFWMCFITITTIGYGDVYPITSVGRVLTMILAILGIGFYSFLTSIIVNSFSKYLDELRRKREIKNLENSKNILKEYKDEIDSKLKELNIKENKEEQELEELITKLPINKEKNKHTIINLKTKIDKSKSKASIDKNNKKTRN